MGRRVAVTGAASGIGAAAAGLLRRRGDAVIGADLSRPEDRQVAAAAVLRRAGGVVDAVVAAAGTAAPTEVSIQVGPENTHTTGQVVFVDGGADATLRGEEAL